MNARIQGLPDILRFFSISSCHKHHQQNAIQILGIQACIWKAHYIHSICLILSALRMNARHSTQMQHLSICSRPCDRSHEPNRRTASTPTRNTPSPPPKKTPKTIKEKKRKRVDPRQPNERQKQNVVFISSSMALQPTPSWQIIRKTLWFESQVDTNIPRIYVPQIH